MKKTNWSEATQSPEKAIAGLISCLNSGKNAWIELQKNGEQDYPIKVKNPALNDPFNWTMAYGVPRDDMKLREHNFFNETDKDLTYNWYAAFSEEKAAKLYREKGKITKGLFNGMGVNIPVKIKDIDEWRAKQGAEKFGYTWVTFWQPKNGVPYWIAADIKDVFVVCYDEQQPANRKEAYLRLANLLFTLAKREDKKGGR